jgi:HEPN domain-containing protein
LKSETEPWWRQAIADLANAELVLKGNSYYATSWFAQQAVEKGLKALFVDRRDTLPPRTLDLNYLGREIAAPSIIAADLQSLNPAFQRTRYPDFESGAAPVDDATEYDATRDIEAAPRVFEWLAQELGANYRQSL